MKGIILGGGNGSRLYPNTSVTNKLLVPVYDKPLVFYPLSILMEAGIDDVMIISNERDQNRFKMLFGDGHDFGIHMSYGVQEVPTGIVSAFLIGEEFIGNEPCALVLGDNIFHGNKFNASLPNALKRANEGLATLYGYEVDDPERFGVVELDDDNNALSIEEKPKNPKSNYAVTGLYFYPSDVVATAKKVKPSARGEYEITDLNNLYLEQGRVKVEKMGKETLWLDAGTFDSLLEASIEIKKAEQIEPIAFPELIAYRKGWLSKEDTLARGNLMAKNSYGATILYKLSV
jgi:glucose-1-phosphate thymidylyltransferase